MYNNSELSNEAIAIVLKNPQDGETGYANDTEFLPSFFRLLLLCPR